MALLQRAPHPPHAAAAPAAAAPGAHAALLLPVAPLLRRQRAWSGAAAAGHRASSSPHQRSVVAQARAGTETQDRIATIATQTIDDIDTNYCDDFECTSSPAVEVTVRSFGRDTLRLQYSAKLFQPDVRYEDGFRSFQGSSKYAKQRFWADNLQRPSVTVVKMRMLDKGTAQVDWRAQGSLGAAGQVDIPVTSTISMNLLTGRIISHREKWDLSKLSPPAALLATLSRVAWSARATAADVSEGANKAISESLSSVDGDSGPSYYNNPSDPTRFFQNQGDSQWQDYVSFATILALLYLMYRAFGELAQLG